MLTEDQVKEKILNMLPQDKNGALLNIWKATNEATTDQRFVNGVNRALDEAGLSE
jgi:hypothetical protein